jgi:segregation and condensation protein B
MSHDQHEYPQPQMSREARLVEAVLYLENEPVDTARLRRYTGLSADELQDVLAELRHHYDEAGHGVELVEMAGGYHFMPKEELWPELKANFGRKIDRRLTRSAMETISIVAYSQPITKREIEAIRGVSSDNVIRLLLDREYIRIIGRKDVLGRPFLYGTTKKFLQDFNLKSISDLPKLPDIDKERFGYER